MADNTATRDTAEQQNGGQPAKEQKTREGRQAKCQVRRVEAGLGSDGPREDGVQIER